MQIKYVSFLYKGRRFNQSQGKEVKKMADPRQTKSSSTEGSGDSDSKSSCCNSEKMSQMMRRFCGGEDGTFDCKAMMQKMCGVVPEKPDQK